MTRRLALALWLCGLLCALAPGVYAAGGTALVSREFDLWPSAVAMGGVAATSRDPLVALWGNPAGLAAEPGQVGAQHTEWIADTRAEQLGAALGGCGRVRLGVSMQLLTTEDIPFRPAQLGVPIPYTDPLGMIEARDFGVGVTAAYRTSIGLDLGTTVRYLGQKIYTDDAGTLALDLGAQWDYSDRIRLGAVISNLGPGLDWGTGVRAPLPRSFRAGIAVRAVPRVRVSADTWIIRDRSVRGIVGAEWQVVPALAVRSGYMAGGDALNFAAGLGIHWRGIGFDYALVPMSNDLGTVHRVALRFIPSRVR